MGEFTLINKKCCFTISNTFNLNTIEIQSAILQNYLMSGQGNRVDNFFSEVQGTSQSVLLPEENDRGQKNTLSFSFNQGKHVLVYWLLRHPYLIPYSVFSEMLCRFNKLLYTDRQSNKSQSIDKQVFYITVVYWLV